LWKHSWPWRRPLTIIVETSSSMWMIGSMFVYDHADNVLSILLLPPSWPSVITVPSTSQNELGMLPINLTFLRIQKFTMYFTVLFWSCTRAPFLLHLLIFLFRQRIINPLLNHLQFWTQKWTLLFLHLQSLF